MILDGVSVIGVGVDVGIDIVVAIDICVFLLMRSKISAGSCGMPFNSVNGFSH